MRQYPITSSLPSSHAPSTYNFQYQGEIANDGPTDSSVHFLIVL